MPSFDWPTLIANKDREIARLEAAYTATLEKAGVKIVKSRAVLADAHTVQLANGERVRAGLRPDLDRRRRRVTATRFPGIEHAISSNEAFHLPELPRRVVIQGGGYIAVEFAGIFAGLGSHVTLVYRGENILRGFDDDVRQHLRVDMENARHQGHHRLQGRGDRAGRRRIFRRSCRTAIRSPPTASCSPPAACRTSPSSGSRRPASRSPRTAASRSTNIRAPASPNIYAVGDVTNRINLTPVAIREGHAFADTVFGGKPTAVDHANVPTAVFSEPEIGDGRPHRGAGARAAGADRHLQGHVQAAQGDAVGPRHHAC